MSHSVPPDELDALAGTVLLTTWHLPMMRNMPRAFWRVRSLDRSSRQAAGLRWMHRWISRRSVMLVSVWESPEAARRWLESPGFHQTDRAIRRDPRVQSRVIIAPIGATTGP